MRRWYIITSVIALVCSLSACSDKAIKPVFQTFNYDNVLIAPHTCHVTLSYVAIANAAQSEALTTIEINNRKFFFDLSSSIREPIESLIERNIESTKSLLKDAGLSTDNPFYKTALSEIKQKGNYLSFTKYTDMYFGGAHSLEGATAINYRLSDGKQLKLNDVFRQESIHTIDLLIMEALCKQLDLPTIDIRALADLGFYPDEVKTTENFRISEEGIDFIFNPYIIGCYAVGLHFVHIPYESLSGMLKIKI